MVVYGYLRVSTKKQDINNNKAEILIFANEKKLGEVFFIQETISGRKDWRNRVLGEEFKKMKSGDVIIMSEYSRIGRDFLQSMEFLAECRRKNILVYSTLGDIPIHDDATSNLLLAMKAWKSQIERDDLAYRTKLGIAAAKEKGSVLGRKRQMILEKEPQNINKIKEMIEKDCKIKQRAKEMDCTTMTLRKFIKKHNLKEVKPKNKKERQPINVNEKNPEKNNKHIDIVNG
jgi:DNA invertase Pin-like site-specific DNA recombinase